MRAAIRSAAKETRGQTARSTRIQSIIPSVAIPLSGRDPPFGRIFRTITGKVPARKAGNETGMQQLIRSAVAIATLCLAVTALAARDGATAASPAPLPTGPYGALVRYGRDIIENTRHDVPHNVTAAMSCEACHLAAGTKPHGGSFVGIFAEFPQWNTRAKRFISLQDRLAECFLYSMNGTPPAYPSREMEALTAYIAWLSQGQPVGTPVSGQGYVAFKPDHAPDAHAGSAVYAQRCAACHGADGGGQAGAFPPLWGPTSFNGGAGMHRLRTMAEFVRYNMPYGSPPNTLTRQQAYDVAAFVLAHPRPAFNKTRLIAFPPLPASFF